MISNKFKYFYFKKYPQDFIVEEKLLQAPKGQGHVFYVMFEKKFTNTMDILKHLQKKLNLKRSQLWIGGLKDKDGITRQWISIYKRTLQSKGWKDKFLSELWKVARILKISWSDTLLKVWDIKGNLFFIRLRPKIQFTKQFKESVENVLEVIKIQWVPNYFGYQRFGKKYKNVKIWFDFLNGKKQLKDPFERQFKLQAVSSFLFNKYLDIRIEKGYLDKKLVWDIFLANQNVGKIFSDKILEKWKQKLLIAEDEKMISKLQEEIPTWPVVGYDILFSPFGTLPYELEMQTLEENKFNLDFLKVYEHVWVYGIRRPIKVYLQDLRYKRDKDDLLLMFELPSGSYASVVIAWMEKLLWEF